MNTRTCPLCNEEKKIVNSHIIPEGFYKKLYDKNKTAMYASKTRKKVKPIQKGEREYLLCEKCDNEIIGKLDKYAIEVIRDKKYIEIEEYSNCIIWDKIDYNKFKLFHLSVLWRASISKTKCKAVNLSNEQSNEIRECILSGKAPSSDKYQIFGLYLIDPENDYENCDGMVTYGNRYEVENIPNSEVYVFIYGGIAWNYVVSNSNNNDFFERVGLKEIGNILLQKEDIRRFKPFYDIYGSVIMAANYKRKK